MKAYNEITIKDYCLGRHYWDCSNMDHIRRFHIEKSEKFLMERIRRNGLYRNSSFIVKEEAVRRAIDLTIKEPKNMEIIKNYLHSWKPEVGGFNIPTQIELNSTLKLKNGKRIGIVINRNGEKEYTDTIAVIIVALLGTTMAHGMPVFKVTNAYPIIKKPF